LRKITKRVIEYDRFSGRDANPGIREYSAAVIPTSPLSSVASVQKKAFWNL